MTAAVSAAVGELLPLVGTKAACAAVGRARATHYRHRWGPRPPQATTTTSSSSPPPSAAAPRRAQHQPRALSAGERGAVLAELHGERFVDAAPPTVDATLLDEGRSLASVPTMYRVLRAAGEVRERRRQATHPPTVKPELVADAPNRIWSWDIERHEALCNRAVKKGHRLRSVAADR